jgi:hypothetical protein
MFYPYPGYSNYEAYHLGGIAVENTHEFVQKLKENQKKQEKNKRTQGSGHPERQLPQKQHD